MIKVCHITSVHKWNDTRIFFKECVSLARAGYDVTLVAPNAPEATVEGVKVVAAKATSGSRIARATIVSARVCAKAFRTKAKIVHFHDPELIWVGLILRLFGRKVIFDIHENIAAQIKVKQWIPARNLVAKLYGIFDWIAAKCFYLVLAEDSYLPIYDKLTKEKNVAIVLNLPDIAQFEKLAPTVRSSSPNGILYIGGVTKVRGIFEMTEAIRLLKDRGIDVHFHCVGPVSPGIIEQLEATETYREVKSSITFYGPIPVYEAYRKAEVCKVGVSILHPIENYLHSYSTKIFEYMATGLPFVVSDFGLYRFVEEKEVGLLVDPLDPESIAAQIGRLLTDEQLWMRLSENGKRVVKSDYSWESQEAKLLRFYQYIAPKSKNS